MKRSWVLAVSLIAAIALAASASAELEGAVRAEFSPNVGWVVLNTTASGKLIATAHLVDGAPNEDFIVAIRIRYEDGTIVPFIDVATLTTNEQGKGNAQVQLNINPPVNSNTLRRVAFRVRRPGPPVLLYVAVAWDIPLK